MWPAWASQLILSLPSPLSECLMADYEGGIFVEMTWALPLLETYTHTHTQGRTHTHTYIYMQACTYKKGWLPFWITGPTLIFKWLFLLPQDFQSISGHILRWRDCQRREGRRHLCECTCRGGELEDDVNDNGGWGQRKNVKRQRGRGRGRDYLQLMG